ncbi:hypothetical protein ACTAF0_08350 [Streptomyces murinus]|uniref:hypothetical protein n=1 Tax=Streptomyces murinus TaxID=33900 RepID=UPI003F488B2C
MPGPALPNAWDAFRWIGAGAALALVRRAARELLGEGTYGCDYGELNALFGRV